MALSVARPPAMVLAEAQVAAKALMDVIKNKPKPVVMNGETYLEFEDWQTVARFYGVSAKVISTTYVTIGGAAGFECKAEAIDNRTGIPVSAAEAMCLNDESKWSSRAKYEWRTENGKRIRKQIGSEPVPMFQLRSMAQTRACAKALRNVLAWVVVLAGFKTTPAEEMDGVFPDERKKSAKPTDNREPADLPEEPQRKQPDPDLDIPITDKQLGAIDRMIKDRPDGDSAWWETTKEHYLKGVTAASGAELIKWLSKKLDAPIPDEITSLFEPKEVK
jgi:hypothetical protein